MSTVKVRCELPNGIVLRIDEMVPDPHMPTLMTARIKDQIALRAGVNEVDADLWTAWLQGHENDVLVSEKIVKLEQTN